MSTATNFEFNLSDVPEGFSADLPAGNYTARLMSSPEMTETKESKEPMLSSRFEILEGPLKGKEQVLRYVLSVKVENGKPKFSQGLIRLKADLKAIGEAIPEGFKLTSANAVKFYGAKFKQKLITLKARNYKPRGWVEGMQLGTGYEIIGLAQMGQNAGAPAGGNATAALAALGHTNAVVADEAVEEEDEFA